MQSTAAPATRPISASSSQTEVGATSTPTGFLSVVEPAKQRLILAAEALFAERSVDSVSLREIALKAGNGNNRAVQYHFGGKEEMMRALVAFRASQSEEPRRRLYAEIRAAGRRPDLADLVRILCLPLLNVVDENGRHSYAAFVSQYILRYRFLRPDDLGQEVGEHNVELRSVMRDILSICGLSEAKSGDPRVAIAYLVFCNMLVLSDNDELKDRDPKAFEQRVESTLNMVTGALAGIKSA